MKIKFPVLLFLLSGLLSFLSASQILLIPRISHPVKVDGVFSPSEWEGAAVFSDFLTLSGFPVQGTRSRIRLMADQKHLYLGISTDPGEQTDTATPFLLANAKIHDSAVHKDDAVEVVIGPSDGSSLHQIITNSKGVVYDSQVHPVTDSTWNLKGLETGNRVQVLHWDLEMKIPLAEVGLHAGGSFYLNICRDWVQHGFSSLSGGGYFEKERLLKVSIAPDAPGFQQLFNQNNRELQFSFKGEDDLDCMVELRTPENKILRSLRKSLSNGQVDFLAPVDRTCRHMLASVSVYRKDRPVLRREFKVRDLSARLLPPPMKELRFNDGSKLDLRFYPGYGRIAFDAAFAPESRNAGISFRGQGPDGCNIRKNFTIADSSVSNSFDLPSRKAGTWKFDATLTDALGEPRKDGTLAFQFTLRDWSWLDKRAGIDDDFIVPPFQPIRRQGNRISLLLRAHSAGALGFWDQITADGRELLSRPVQLHALVKGQPVAWTCRPVRIEEERSSRLVLRYSGKGGGLHADVLVTYEYDGMAWYRLTMRPTDGPVQVEELSLSLGMKAEEAKYIHAVADSIRRNVCGALPDGQGEIWNSLSVPRMQYQNRDIVRDGFIPYLWFGGISRGLCFFADSPENYHLVRKNPMIRLFRRNQSVEAKILLWGSKVRLTGARALEFGFMATPVKPKADFNRRITGITYGKLPGAEIMMFPPRPAGFINDFDHQPRGSSTWELYGMLGQQIHHRNVPEDRWRELMENWRKDLVEYWTPFRGKLKRAYGKYMGRRDPVDYMTGRITREFENYYGQAGNCDKLIYYSDPRLVHVHTPEYQDFQAEWWCTRKVGYLGAARTFLVPSFIDYMLWSVEQQLSNGVDGIYYDDTFLLPRANAELGRPEAEMGILAMRDLIKRTAVLMCRHGMPPRIMVHYTDALVIPAFSFANLGFTWEMRFNPVDTQIRFPEDYILTESSGLQAGITPFIINGIKHWNGFAGTPQWPAFFKHKSKSIIATAMQYDIKLWSNWDIRNDVAYWTLYPMYRFGIGEKDCRLLPYWENGDLLSTGQNYRGALYLKKNSALIFLSNFGSRKPAALALDLRKAGLPEDTVVTDLLTGESWAATGTAHVSVPFHEYTLLHAGKPEEARRLLPEEGRLIINNPMTLQVNPDNGSIRRNMFLKANPWIKRPGFVKNPLTEQASLNQDAQENLIFTVDNRQGKDIGSMVWTLDIPLEANQKYDGMQIFLTMENMLTGNPVCFSGKDDSGSSKVHYLNAGKHTRKTADGLEISSASVMKGIQTITRFYVRVEALPGKVGQMVLKDIRLIENQSGIQGRDRILKLKQSMAWVNRPNFVGKNGGRISADRTTIGEQPDGHLVFKVDNTGSAAVAGMVWTLDMPVLLDGNFQGMEVVFAENNLDDHTHFYPLAFSCILKDGKHTIRNLNLRGNMNQLKEPHYINAGILKDVTEIRRIFIRVHAAPDSIGSLTLKKITLTNPR